MALNELLKKYQEEFLACTKKKIVQQAIQKRSFPHTRWEIQKRDILFV
jgi:hypothetical protein